MDFKTEQTGLGTVVGRMARKSRHKQRHKAQSGAQSGGGTLMRYLSATVGGLATGATAAHLLYSQGYRLGLNLKAGQPEARDLTPDDYEARDPGRGRLAQAPHQIPLKGWIDILWRTGGGFFGDRVSFVAGGVTFFTLLALFPALAAFVTIYGLFANPSDAWGRLDFIYEMLPGNVASFIGNEMTRLAGSSTSQLTFTLAGTLLLSLWAANGGVKNLFYGLNLAYHEVEKRSLVKFNLITLGCTLTALLGVVIASFLVVGVPVIVALFGLEDEWVYLAPLRWPILLVLYVFGLNLVYRIGPSRTSPRWRWLTPGATAAAVLSLLVSLLFSWFLTNFVRTDSYGPLSAAMGFLLWTWISLQVLLMGARLNAEIEHQVALDTTVGPVKPMGERGARMADSIGKRRGQPPGYEVGRKVANRVRAKISARRAARSKSPLTPKP